MASIDRVQEVARGRRSRSVLATLITEVGMYIEDIRRPYEDTILVSITRDGLVKASLILSKGADVFFRTMMASDERELRGVYVLYYVFGIDSEGTNIVLEVTIPSYDPKAPSISDIIKAADWCELEAHDLLGIEFEGRTLHRFVLPEDWPENVYPLRKDYSVEELHKLYIPKAVEYAKRIEAEQVVMIPIGPYHPALHEPEYFELYVRGEKIVDVRYVGFMVHRGIEKIAERMKYDQVPFLAERICGICGFTHSTAYCQAVEAAAEIEVPERAEYIRTIMLEIERIHSHLLWIGVAFHLLGYDTGFMHVWRIRERIMLISELLSGSRKTYGINVVGGVRRDIDEEKVRKTLEALDWVNKEFRNVINVALSVPQVRRRLSGIGVLPRGEARALSVVGPVARGSGLNRDVRRDFPYAAYHRVSFKVPVYSDGDNFARALVRIEEVFESIDILRQLLDTLPKGEIRAESRNVESGKLGIGNVEAPRGELIHVVITGYSGPYRWRVRAPTYQNLPAVPLMLRGVELADAPITIASIDPCFSCTDRAIVIDIGRGSIDYVPIQYLSLRRARVG